MVGERCTVMDLLTARNGAPPPPVQTKSTRNEGRKRSFWRWQRRALKAARDHEGREAAEAVQAAERNQQRAAQRRAKAAALDRKTAARHRRHRDCLLKQIKKGARLLNQQKEKRAAEERRKCRRQQHEEMLQRAAERKRKRRERHNLTAALAQRRHWRLGLKMLLLLVIFAAYLECAAAMLVSKEKPARSRVWRHCCQSSNDANPEPGPAKATDDSSRWRAQQHHSAGIEHTPREQRQFERFLHELAGHLFLVREPGEIARIYAHGSGANAR